MQIGGLQKFSIIDYPGKMSCVVFCRGCSLRCKYCHNQDLQDFNGHCEVTLDILNDFLKKRIGLLDAVVFSGGEPLYQNDLLATMFHVKHYGFLVGLHTSGILPLKLQTVLDVVDWVGLDIKTVFSKYELVTGVQDSGIAASKSLDILANSGIDYEVRTTYDSRYISEDDLTDIANLLAQKHVKQWVIQRCILRKGDDNEYLPLPSSQLIDYLSNNIIPIRIRE